MEESELYNLLETAGDAAFVVDQQGQILYWSRKAEDLLGFRKEQVVTKNCADVLPAATRPEHRCAAATVECWIWPASRGPQRRTT